MPRMADHVTEEDLEQYCLGGLTEVRCARLEEHLLLCGTCRDRLPATENFVRAMRQAPPVPPLLLELDLTGLSEGHPVAGQGVDASGAPVAEFPVSASVRLQALP